MIGFILVFVHKKHEEHGVNLLLVVINQGTSLYDFDQTQMDFSLTEKCGQQNYFKDYSTSAQEIS